VADLNRQQERDFMWHDIRVVRTCFACPEQYDAFDQMAKQVGYLRLRHGVFRVDVPDCGGTTVFEAHPNGDGIFESDECEHFLKGAIDAIVKHIAESLPRS
jgi:hypothetical protein